MKKVSLSARILYSMLSGLARKHGYAWPSQSYLARRLGVSLRTINSLVGELKKAHLLQVEDPTATRSTCLYRPKANAPERRNQTVGRPCVGVRKGGAQSLRTTDNKDICIREKTPPTPPRGGAAAGSPVDLRLEEFEGCYSSWPLQQDRKGALRTWKRLARRDQLPAPGKILATIEDFRGRDAYWKRQKYPAFRRWLRNHRWEDQPHSVSTPPPSAPAPSASIPHDLEVQAKGQLSLVRLAIETGEADSGVDEVTHKIIAGYGGVAGLRLMPRREIGFILSGFAKEYAGLHFAQRGERVGRLETLEPARVKPGSGVGQARRSNSSLTAAVLEAANFLRRVGDVSSEVFDVCMELAKAGRLPSIDTLKSKHQHREQREPAHVWLVKEFGGANA